MRALNLPECLDKRPVVAIAELSGCGCNRLGVDSLVNPRDSTGISALSKPTECKEDVVRIPPR